MNGVRSSAVLMALCAVAIAGCGGGDGSDDRPVTVEVTEAGYEPADLRIPAGTRVVFVNRSKKWPQSAKDDRRGDIEVSPQPGPTQHDGTEVNRATMKGFATHSLFPGERQTVIFGVARKYDYHSAFDSEMTGSIEVVQPSDK